MKLFQELLALQAKDPCAGQFAGFAAAVPRRALVWALGVTAPREGFRAWAARMFVLGGVLVFDQFLQLLPGGSSGAGAGAGPAPGGATPLATGRAQAASRSDFCEVVGLFNGNVEEAGEWFDALSSDSRQAQGKACGETALELGVIKSRALGNPRLEGAPDAELPLTLEEICIRLVMVWGDLTSAFGLAVVKPEVHRTSVVPRSHLVQAVKEQCRSQLVARRGWRPQKGHWSRALQGKFGRHLFKEKDTRLEVDRLSAIADMPDPLFPNVCDRLLVTKNQWRPHELITVRYMLSDHGFWGACGPPPVAAGGRRLPLGQRPFVAAVLRPGDGLAEEDEETAAQQTGFSDVVMCRAYVDPHASCSSVLLRTPEQRSATHDGFVLVSHWDLRLYGSDDGVNPTAVLSAPLPIEVVITAPSPPEFVSGEDCTHESAVVKWSDSVDNGGSSVLLYEAAVWEWQAGVECAESCPAVWSLRTEDVSARAFPLRADCRHVARVRCGNSAGMGPWSEVSAPFSTGPPLPRELDPPVVVSVDQTEVQLCWAPRADHVVTHYAVHVLPVPPDGAEAALEAFVQLLDGAATEARIGRLAANTIYHFQVRAHNVSGFGPWSRTGGPALTRPGVPQAPPPVLALEAAEDALRITWEQPHNNGGACITGYNVKVEGVPPSFAKGVEAVVVAPPAWVRGLQGNTWYAVSVAAVNAMGAGAHSLAEMLRTGAVPPDPPRNLVAVDLAAEHVTLRWDSPLEDGGDDVIRYHVRAAPTPPHTAVEVSVEACPGGTCVVLPQLRGALEYVVTVQSETRRGLSPVSAPLALLTNCTVPGPPPQPPRLQGDATMTSIPVRWDPPHSDGGSRVLQYELLLCPAERCPPGGSPGGGSRFCCGSAVGSAEHSARGPYRAATCSAVADGLGPGEAYCFAVRAENERGWGPCSRWSAPIPTAPPVPGAPARPRPIVASSRSIAIEWDPPDSEVHLLEYEVWCGMGMPEAYEALPVSAPMGGRRNRTKRTALRVSGLAPSARYIFRVRARNVSGWSPWSGPSEACCTTDTCTLEEVRAIVLRRLGGTVASAWRAFDRDCDGAVTREEFLGTFDDAKLTQVPIEQRLRLFAVADENNTGRLGYREFAHCFTQYKATPALMRQLMPEMSGARRQEVLEEILQGKRSTSVHNHPKVANAVERLTTPRSRIPRTMSERTLQVDRLQQHEEGCCSGRRVSGSFPYRSLPRSRSVEEFSESQLSERSYQSMDTGGLTPTPSGRRTSAASAAALQAAHAAAGQAPPIASAQPRRPSSPSLLAVPQPGAAQERLLHSPLNQRLVRPPQGSRDRLLPCGEPGTTSPPPPARPSVGEFLPGPAASPPPHAASPSSIPASPGRSRDPHGGPPSLPGMGRRRYSACSLQHPLQRRIGGPGGSTGKLRNQGGESSDGTPSSRVLLEALRNARRHSVVSLSSSGGSPGAARGHG